MSSETIQAHYTADWKFFFIIVNAIEASIKNRMCITKSLSIQKIFVQKKNNKHLSHGVNKIPNLNENSKKKV